MSEILLQADDARSAADAVVNAATDAHEQFTTLRSRLAPLADSFKGKTATAWDSKYHDWDQSAKSLMEALDDLGKFLNTAATAIEDTDTNLAGQLG